MLDDHNRYNRVFMKSAFECCADSVVTGDIGASTDWSAALRDVEYVVHATWRLDGSSDTEVAAIQPLAIASARARVRRFVCVSSVKINDEQTPHGAFTPFDVANPRMPTRGRNCWLSTPASGGTNDITWGTASMAINLYRAAGEVITG